MKWAIHFKSADGLGGSETMEFEDKPPMQLLRPVQRNTRLIDNLANRSPEFLTRDYRIKSINSTGPIPTAWYEEYV